MRMMSHFDDNRIRHGMLDIHGSVLVRYMDDTFEVHDTCY